MWIRLSTFSMQFTCKAIAIYERCLQIVHRRLAVRNVLLRKTSSGFVAKLIGFGPTNDDADDADVLVLS